MAAPQLGKRMHELEQVGIRVVPVHPGDLVVLAVAIVVALLGPPHLVPRQHHRDALRAEQCGQEIPLLPGPQAQDRRIGRGSLGTAVPRPVVVGAVGVAFAVRLVVLAVVAHQILEGKTVMAGDEVHGGDGPPAARLVQVARAAQPRAEIGQRARLTAPEVTDGVAVYTVPLTPQWGEVTNLVPPFADVPWLGDQLYLGDDRILLYKIEK